MPFSSHHLKCTYYQHDLSTVVINPDHLAKVVFVMFLYSLLPVLNSLEGNHYVQSTFKELEFCVTPLRAEYLHKLFEILLPERFFSSYLFVWWFVCLYQHWLIAIYFIYKSMLEHLFCSSNCSSFGLWEHFQLVPESF